uniref:Uncharacterized protein n=1 Tax=Arundo donax TaxID=35708 RepID=A0A0A9H8K8_ARUDO
MNCSSLLPFNFSSSEKWK